MVICSRAVTAEGNFALMNVNAAHLKPDFQNEIETIDFSGNSEHNQQLVNGFVSDEAKERCSPLTPLTNGETEEDCPIDENELAKKNLTGSSLELPKLAGNVISPTNEVCENEAMLNTIQHNGGLAAPLISDRSNHSCSKVPDLVSEIIHTASNGAPTVCGNESARINCLDTFALPDTIPNLEGPIVSFENDLERRETQNLESLCSLNVVSAENAKSLDGKAGEMETDSNSSENPENARSELMSVPLNGCSQELGDSASEANHTAKNLDDSNLVKELDASLLENDHSKKTSAILQPNSQLENSVLDESPVKSIEIIEKVAEVQFTPSHTEKSAIDSEDTNSKIYSMNIQDYANLKVECSHYKSENEQLQHKLSILESELNSFKSQQAQLLSTIEQQEKQLKQINETAQRQQEVDARSYAALKQELESQNEKLKQECETTKREREVSVMRYAKSEMDVIQLREKVEACQKKLQEAIKERDSAQGNMKQLITDKTKYSQMYDNKCSEVRVAHNEVEQLKSDLNSRNIKLKWAQNKLKEEQDSHKETQLRLDEVTSTIQAARNEAEQAKLDAQASIKTFKESQENRAFVLDQQLKEEQAKLILVRAEKDDREKKIQQLTSKLQQVEAEAKALNEKNTRLTDQLQSIEKEKLEMDVKLNTMQQLMNKEVQENVELESQLSEMRTLRLELEQEKKKLESLESEAMKLRSSNAELLIDMDSCRKREAEMLEFTERLTAQNVKLQSDYSALQAKNEELEMEQSKIDDLKAELEKEKSQRIEENKILARHVAEHSQRCEELSRQLAEQKSENVVIRRKNAATIRELTRELQQAKKHSLEHNSDGGGSGSNSLCQDSRASSCASLTDTSQGLSSTVGSITVEPDKQTLIERIVELQRKNAQYLDKIEFLEEHNQEMTEELKKKTKIVQNFMLREPVGALSSNSMDSNKLFLRQPLQFTKEMALSKKGYMASLYSSKIKDKNMTLEKSLEICQTLHSLLEDTILKNITLKVFLVFPDYGHPVELFEATLKQH